ncbi:MAG: HAMP domain-containing sensor histidine kinase [Intestinibacter bartlettii]|uniref:sensor histidine kinase n=1 Tax=Intestinibacter bartlettii TaxID=261299 RepID=UPI0026F2BC38|nr:HAMP domain-containing sensor histidine kinase [Intestinibacter bartlettii]MDO5011060.1 HAMP domain-containing sensor histidine kinase [Intestinibacter bartlettii]
MISKEVIAKTQRRLIKINMLVVSGFLILLCIFTYIYFGYTNNNNINKEMEGELNSIINQVENLDARYGLMLGLKAQGIKLQNPKDMVYMYIDNTLIKVNSNPYFGDKEPNFENQGNGFYTYTTSEGYQLRECNYTYKNCTIRIFREISSEISSRRQLLLTMIKVVIVFCVLTYFIAIYLTRNALKPIEVTWNNQAKFIQDASHELRTPITIVSSKLEGLLKHPNNTINDEVEGIADAMNETRRLKKMINDLLTLTKEDYADVVEKEEFDLEALVKDLCDDFFDIAMIQNKTLKISSQLKHKNIVSDKNKLRQLLIIFIDNAFKYTEQDDYIKISLNEKDEKNYIKIEDNGFGIKKEEIPHLFDRFFRSENVRNKDIDGSGIGLSIAKVLSESLKYKLKVDSEYGKWTMFEIIIPIDMN